LSQKVKIKQNRIICAWHWWLTPVIPATQESKIRRIEGQSQPRQNSSTRPCLKKNLHKKGLVQWLKVCPEFKLPVPQTRKKGKIKCLGCM
jgi:hypothetical protein